MALSLIIRAIVGLMETKVTRVIEVATREAAAEDTKEEEDTMADEDHLVEMAAVITIITPNGGFSRTARGKEILDFGLPITLLMETSLREVGLEMIEVDLRRISSNLII